MYLYVIPPLAMTDAMLDGASMAEDSTSAWASGTTYAAGDRVHVVTTTLAKSTSEAWAQGDDLYWNTARSIATTTVIAGKEIGKAAAAALAADATGSVAVHAVFESAQAGNLGNNPVSDAAADAPAWWVRVGATNRWKPFDGKNSDPCEDTADLVWNIIPASTVSAVALLGLTGAAAHVSIAEGIAPGTLITADTIIGEGGTVLYDETRSLVDNSGVEDWWTYFYGPVGEVTSEVLFQDVPGYAGKTIVVEVTASSGTRRVGEVVLGYEETVGRMTGGASVGITDYSRKDFDEFGNPIIIERVYADTATYPIFMAANEVRRTKRLLARLRATPAVYHVGADNGDFGLLVYGFFREMPFSLESGPETYLNLEVEGLT